MKTKADTSTYAKMGMAAMLPGMVHMLELMQAEVDRFRSLLAEAQGEHEQAEQPVKRSGWPTDPAERKAEMARRQKVAAAKKNELSEKRKKEWAALSPAKRKKRLAAMAAGKKPNVKLAEVA